METESKAAKESISPHVLEVVRSAQQELAGLFQRRAEIVRRIGTIRQMLAGMSSLFGDGVVDRDLLVAANRAGGRGQPGFTRVCRLILMESQTPLSVRQACETMRRRFPELAERHKDLTASVTTVFHRMASYEEARCLVNETGTRVWEWATDAKPAAAVERFALSTEPGRNRDAGDRGNGLGLFPTDAKSVGDAIDVVEP